MGQKFPLYIHSFSEWRAPLLMYATAPFTGILGLNAWAVRLPPIIFGIFGIFLVYILVKDLTGSERLSLLTAFTLAVVPWHIHYSRTAFEATLLLFLLLLGTIGAVRGIGGSTVRRKWLAVAAISFGLTFYTYNTANVFTPLWLLGLLIIYRHKIFSNLRAVMLPSAILLGLFLPLALITINGQGAARFKLISIFNNPKTINEVVFKRTTGLDNKVAERIFHNKITGWGKEFVSNYLTAFSPQFLFLAGDPNPRHNLPMFGELYWILLPLLLIGVWRLLLDQNLLFKKIVFAWLIISPLASCLTIGGGNQATRLFLMLPPLAILIAVGWNSLPPRLFKLQFLLVSIALTFWLHSYFIHYPKEQYRYWHYGYQKSMVWLNEREKDYPRIIINERHEPALIRYLFWTHKPLDWFWNNFQGDGIKKNVMPNLDGFTLGKVTFGIISSNDKQKWLEKNLRSNDLYLAFQKDEIPGDWYWDKNPPVGIKVLKTIYTPWGKPLMYWITKSGTRKPKR